jgi:hypothetical protein
MATLGFLLLNLLGAPPGVRTPGDDITISGVRWVRGEEIVYTGGVLEASDRIENRYRKQYSLEVRLFVLEVNREGADCALMTSISPQEDPLIAKAPGSQSGAASGKAKIPPAVRLELVRVDSRGRVLRLEPPLGPPPIPLKPETRTTQFPAISLEGIPSLELGLFVPWPVEGVQLGSRWDTTEPDRPPLGWQAKDTREWNGGRTLRVQATQQTPNWDRVQGNGESWMVTRTALVPPADGYAAVVEWQLIRRLGREQVGSLQVKYERQPTIRHVGGRYTDVRADVEQAWWMAAELAEMHSQSGRVQLNEVRTRLTRIEQYLSDTPVRSNFRSALEATRRRYANSLQGSAPPVVIVTAHSPDGKPEPLSLGKPAPDFVVGDLDRPTGKFRLSAARGKPCVLIFFKPNSVTSKGALELAEALHQKFQGKVHLLPLACGPTTDEASGQRKRMLLTVPVYDGEEPQKLFKVDTYPKFVIVDSQGMYVWELEGCGNETGFFLKTELDRQLGLDGQRPGR